MSFLSFNLIQMDWYVAFSVNFLYLYCCSSSSLYRTFWGKKCLLRLMHRMAGREGFLMTSYLI